jgi:hypothetical protein
MNKMLFLLLVIIAYPVFAGDLWEINSTSIGPDGTPQPYTQKSCFPKDSLDPSKVLEGIGNCIFDQKSGNPSAMTFIMTCKTTGMPADLASMKVSGDARLNGDKFDMRYTIAAEGTQALPGSNFKMNGSAEAHKIGQCDER